MAIHDFDLLERHMPSSVTSRSAELSTDLDEHVFDFGFPNLLFQLCLSSDHQQLLSCEVRDVKAPIRRRVLDPMRQDVRAIFHALYGSQESTTVRGEDVQVAILQALERLAEYQEETLAKETAGKRRYAKGWSADEIADWDVIVNNPFGLDASTIRDTASFLLGKTPEAIVKLIPPSWRVVHMESILREDLLSRFTRYQSSKRETLLTENNLRGKLSPHSKLEGRVKSTIPKDQIIEDMVTPRMTFHGTPLRSVRSIIRHGFLLPGKLAAGKRIQSPRSGIAFDRGIYSSQSAAYAMSYASGQREMTPLGMMPSLRLFVCATIMARTYHRRMGPPEKVHGPLVDGFDSHFDGGFEYIVHEEPAMLPCYVIHLDLGSAEAQRSIKAAQEDPMAFHQDFFASKQKDKTHPRLNNGSAMSPGDVKREQLAKKAAAMKWFPYGFGSASGTRFVIEEIGEVSEDDEEYGEWQEDKHAYVSRDDLDKEAPDEDEYGYLSWDEDEEKMVTKTKRPGLFLDKYQSARKQGWDKGGEERDIDL